MAAQQKLILVGVVFAGLAVAIGAFGAHALKTLLLENDRTETFELAVRYQFLHALALLTLAALDEKLHRPKAIRAAQLFSAGIIVFSGSLYLLSISGVTSWGAVTPVGGLLLLTGWLMAGLAIKKNRANP